jgi:hypothetical protein
MTKKCSSCGQAKNLKEFKNEKRNVDGKMGQCRKCVNSIRRARRARNITHCQVKEAEYNKKQVDSGYCNNYYHRTRTPQNRLIMSFRSLLRRCLKGQIKKSKTKDYLGCTLDEIKIYLEKQFTKEMNWENYGTYWQVDHIIPCKAFNFSDDEQIKKCYHYSNLQPLPKSVNISKSDKLPNGNRARFIIHDSRYIQN